MEIKFEETARLGLIPVEEIVSEIVATNATEKARVSSLLWDVIDRLRGERAPGDVVPEIRMVLEWCRPFLDAVTYGNLLHLQFMLNREAGLDVDEDEIEDEDDEETAIETLKGQLSATRHQLSIAMMRLNPRGKHPHQKVQGNEFVPNRIIQKLVEQSGIDPANLLTEETDPADWRQFQQLMGASVDEVSGGAPFEVAKDLQRLRLASE